MFTVHVRIKQDTSYAAGLNALDMRRKLGLPDAVEITPSADFFTVPVSEEFARTHKENFERKVGATFYVGLSNLKPEEVGERTETAKEAAEHDGPPSHVVYIMALPEARITELLASGYTLL